MARYPSMAALKAIRETGSLNAAVDKMGLVCRQTWGKLKKIKDQLGFELIERLVAALFGEVLEELKEILEAPKKK